jgi:hypothetical protein
MFAGAALALALATAPRADAGSFSIDFSFTGFDGAFAATLPGGDPANSSDYFLVGAVNGVTPVYDGHFVDSGFGGDYVSGHAPLSGQTATFAYTNLPGAVANVVSFTPEASYANILPGQEFKIGTISFTNGQWVGGSFDPANNMPSYLHFRLTTTSIDTPAFNQQIDDSIVVVTNQLKNQILPDGTDLCATPAGADHPPGMHDEADFVYVQGGSFMGSARVPDQFCMGPADTNQGTVDLYTKFGSLDYVALRNPGGSAFLEPGTGVGPINAVPEPSSWTMLILGLGALGGAARARRRAFAIGKS